MDNLNITHGKDTDVLEAEVATKQSIHPGCLLDKNKGSCLARFTRFYYSLTADACIQFTWTGCGGNANNHETEEECLDKCTGSGRTTITNFPTQLELKNPEEVCPLSKDSGNCKGRFDRFFFDPNSGNCKSFLYGGCQGNENNFRSLQECQEFCKSVMPEQERNYDPTMRGISDCSLKLDIGTCFGNISMFYFDEISSVSCYSKWPP